MYSGYSFVCDIDGTLCPIKGKDERYEDLVPYLDMVAKLRYYRQNGAKIVCVIQLRIKKSIISRFCR